MQPQETDPHIRNIIILVVLSLARYTFFAATIGFLIAVSSNPIFALPALLFAVGTWGASMAHTAFAIEVRTNKPQRRVRGHSRHAKRG